MYIIDFKTETIQEVDADGICMFVNNLIKKNSSDLLSKRYLFLPDEDTAYYIVDAFMERKFKYETKH